MHKQFAGQLLSVKRESYETKATFKGTSEIEVTPLVASRVRPAWPWVVRLFRNRRAALSTAFLS